MNSLEICNFVLSRLVEYEPKEKTETDDDFNELSEVVIDPVPCASFRDLCKIYDENIEFTDEIKYCLASMIAVIASTSTAGGQLGLRVLGPPGSFKSTLAECVSACQDHVYALSKFTGLVSGHEKSRGKAKQLAQKLRGKTVVVKDADTFTQLPNRAQVESEVRDVLGDGVIRVEYRTGDSYTIQTDFNFIMCGTKVLRDTDDSLLGSRFLDIVVHKEGQDATHIAHRAMDSQFSAICDSFSDESHEDEVKLKKLIPQLAGPTAGLIITKKEQIAKVPEIEPVDTKTKELFVAMAQLVAVCRSRIDKGKSDEVKYRPEEELPTRLSEHLIRLAVFLAIILDSRKTPHSQKIKITKSVIKIITKIVVDTAYSFQFDVIRCLYETDKNNKNREGLPKEIIASEIQLNGSQTFRLLQDMFTLGILTRNDIGNIHGRRGRKAHYYILSDRVYDLCKRVLG